MRYLILLIMSLVAYQVKGEVQFSANFSGGSYGSAKFVKDSIVECGNSTITSSIYAVETRLDPPNPHYAEAHRSRRWYYFLMSGVKGRTISLDINYNDAKRPFYSYDNRTFHRFSEAEVPEESGRITKRYDHDSVYVAYFVPYGVERNNAMLNKWSQSPNSLRFTIGETAANTPLEMVLLTDNPHRGLIPNEAGQLNFSEADKAKKIVYIHGRIHPGETPLSFHLEAIVDRLTDGSEASQELLKNTIFYILPFANPDGVAGGFSRSTPEGINLEVNYIAKPTSTSAETAAIKRFLSQIASAGLYPSIMLNMHSQSAPKTTYWVHSAASTSEVYHRKLMLFAALTIDRNPYFRWVDLSHSKLRDYFLESWAQKLFKNRTIALTFETPYSHYHSCPDGEWVTLKNLEAQATNSLNAICDILGLSSYSRITCAEPKNGAGFKRHRDNQQIYFGDQYLAARRAGKRLIYTADLPSGDYGVYRWSVGKISAPTEFEKNQWVYLENIKISGTQEYRYTISAKQRGEIFDQLLFVKLDK